MTLNLTKLCRLCCSTNSSYAHTIKEEIFNVFSSLIPSVDFGELNTIYNDKVCQLCYGKTKICIDFIEKVKESQSSLKSMLKKRKIEDAPTTSDILKRMERNGGISIKKVKMSEKREEQEIIICSDEDEEENFDNDLLQEVEFTQSMDEAYDDDDFSIVDDDSDEDFKPSNAKFRKIPSKSSSFTIHKKESVTIDAPINFTCAKCKDSFISFDILSAHMKSRVCFTEKITCTDCDREFQTKRQLYSHKQTHRKKEKVMCDACAKEFNSSFDLEHHMEAVHRRVVKTDCIFRCTHCNETFNSHLDLLGHVKQHQSEKKDAPRLCEICAKVCSNQKSYQAHMSSHKAKSFICEICKKGFSKKFQLTQHDHVHTGIKAFSCELCQKSYAKRESLRVHKKKEHPES